MKYKKKIELMVRKPDKDAEEVEEALVPCVFCRWGARGLVAWVGVGLCMQGGCACA